MFSKKLMILGVASFLVATSLFGAKVHVLKSTIAEEVFQTLIVTEILKKMGHEIVDVSEVNYDIAFQTIANNAKSEDVYFLASMWDPLHNTAIKAVGGDSKIKKYNKFILNCAQGYLIDKKTAEKYNIKYLNDLKDPKIAKLFDHDNDGKADLSGCNAGWGCEKVIEHQLDAYKLRNTVEHNQGEYSALIADTIANYKTGKSILYYTWTPYWVSGKLIPGKDVVFLQVTHSANPNTSFTKLPNGADYGFNINHQRVISNISVEKNHKDIAKLFNIIKIDVNDISGQNMLMTNGQNKEKDIKRHAKIWIEKNQAKIDKWIKEAKAAN